MNDPLLFWFLVFIALADLIISTALYWFARRQLYRVYGQRFMNGVMILNTIAVVLTLLILIIHE